MAEFPSMKVYLISCDHQVGCIVGHFTAELLIVPEALLTRECISWTDLDSNFSLVSFHTLVCKTCVLLLPNLLSLSLCPHSISPCSLVLYICPQRKKEAVLWVIGMGLSAGLHNLVYIRVITLLWTHWSWHIQLVASPFPPNNTECAFSAHRLLNNGLSTYISRSSQHNLLEYKCTHFGMKHWCGGPIYVFTKSLAGASTDRKRKALCTLLFRSSECLCCVQKCVSL